MVNLRKGVKTMPRQPMKPIGVPPDLYERLKARMHPHQAIAGVIEELLNVVDKIDKPKDTNDKGL